MHERHAQIVLMVRAFEEADREGRLLTSYARAAATRRAMRVTGLADWQGDLTQAANIRNGETVLRRARLLYDALGRKVPALRGLLTVAQLGVGTAPAVIGTALIAGVLTNALGPERRINLLSFPLLGILAWNVSLYVLMAGAALARAVRRRLATPPEGRSNLAASLAEVFLKGAIWRRLHGWKLPRSTVEPEITAKALLRFGASWHRVASPLLASRVRRIFHIGAITLVVGVVAGMYLRGLAFEYRATWESTLLDAADVQAILGVVLGPAAFLIGAELPDVTPLRGSEGDAALWIHLYAVTALVVVVVPRTLLALLESWRSVRLSELSLDLEDGYFHRLFTEWRGATRRVRIMPYSFSPKPALLESLKALLHDFFGARADIVVGQALAYGSEASEIPLGREYRKGPWVRSEEVAVDDDRQECYVVLFNLAQSPEAEVHGVFVEALKGRLDERGAQLLVALDVSGYRQRVDSPERLKERARAWRRIVREAELSALELDPDRPVDDAAVAAVGASLWPSAGAAEAGG